MHIACGGLTDQSGRDLARGGPRGGERSNVLPRKIWLHPMGILSSHYPPHKFKNLRLEGGLTERFDRSLHLSTSRPKPHLTYPVALLFRSAGNSESFHWPVSFVQHRLIGFV